MPSLLDEQIEKLATRTLKPWFDTALHGATDADHKAADVWLKVRHSALEKSFTDFDAAVKVYIAIDKALRQKTSDPDVLKAAQKVEQAATIVITLLADMAKNVKWPTPSKLFPVVDAEHKSLSLASLVLQKSDRHGNVTTTSVEGGTPRETHRIEVEPTPDGTAILHDHLANFENAKKAAMTAKADFIKKKLDAKAAFATYEAYIKKIKPEYHARTIDWTDDAAWEKIQDNPALVEAYLRGQANQPAK